MTEHVKLKTISVEIYFKFIDSFKREACNKVRCINGIKTPDLCDSDKGFEPLISVILTRESNPDLCDIDKVENKRTYNHRWRIKTVLGHKNF